MAYEAASYSYIFMAVVYALAFIVVGTFMVLRGKRRSERDQIRRLNQLEEMARMMKKKADGDLKEVKEEEEGDDQDEEEMGGTRRRHKKTTGNGESERDSGKTQSEPETGDKQKTKAPAQKED